MTKKKKVKYVKQAIFQPFCLLKMGDKMPISCILLFST